MWFIAPNPFLSIGELLRHLQYISAINFAIIRYSAFLSRWSVYSLFYYSLQFLTLQVHSHLLKIMKRALYLAKRFP